MSRLLICQGEFRRHLYGRDRLCRRCGGRGFGTAKEIRNLAAGLAVDPKVALRATRRDHAALRKIRQAQG